MKEEMKKITKMKPKMKKETTAKNLCLWGKLQNLSCFKVQSKS